jgi:hypothetical protein
MVKGYHVRVCIGAVAMLILLVLHSVTPPIDPLPTSGRESSLIPFERVSLLDEGIFASSAVMHVYSMRPDDQAHRVRFPFEVCRFTNVIATRHHIYLRLLPSHKDRFNGLQHDLFTCCHYLENYTKHAPATSLPGTPQRACGGGFSPRICKCAKYHYMNKHFALGSTQFDSAIAILPPSMDSHVNNGLKIVPGSTWMSYYFTAARHNEHFMWGFIPLFSLLDALNRSRDMGGLTAPKQLLSTDMHVTPPLKTWESFLLEHVLAKVVPHPWTYLVANGAPATNIYGAFCSSATFFEASKKNKLTPCSASYNWRKSLEAELTSRTAVLVQDLTIPRQDPDQGIGSFLFNDTHASIMRLALWGEPEVCLPWPGKVTRALRTAIVIRTSNSYGEGRQFYNVIDVLRLMRRKFGSSSSTIVHQDENTPYVEQIQNFRRFDVVVTPFGSQNGLIRFSCPGAVQIDLLPDSVQRLDENYRPDPLLREHGNLSTLVDPYSHRTVTSQANHIRYYQTANNPVVPATAGKGPRPAWAPKWFFDKFEANITHLSLIFDDILGTRA